MKNIIEKVAARADITKALAKGIMDVVFDEIAISLKEKNDVSVPQFGKFVVVEKPAGKARNPSTGKEIKVAAKTVMKFKASSILKKRINEK